MNDKFAQPSSSSSGYIPKLKKRMRLLVTLGMTSGALAAGTLAASAPASASTYLGGVNMQQACAVQYPGFGLRAVVQNQYNAYSWKCAQLPWWPWGHAVGIDVNRECVTQYGPGAHAGLWNSYNPYTWFCQR
jgi:hypothetical protein